MSYPDLNKICRLCLKEDSADVNIFSGKINVSMRIMQVAAIEVQATDDLPDNICEECRIQLEKSYLFRKRCQISDNKLKKHLRF
uniref:ZAD domain-containing protein n=1 Tax=Megaselia scalaris TaxID=36166 RepID=T1GP75_MEGSC